MKFVLWAIWIVALIVIVLLVGALYDHRQQIEYIEECPKDVIKYTFKK